MHRRIPTLALIATLVALPAAAQDAQHAGHAAAAAGPGVPLIEGLGTLTHPISTRVPAAQAYFDQGLRLAYAFNHAEAARAFREAARLDSTCAICWWGVAYVHGPNINLPLDSANAAAAYDAIERAQALAGSASAAERAYIAALAQRYGPTTAGQPARDSAYARAMAKLAAAYPADIDALTLHADAVMNLSPWNYWAGGKPRPQTGEILQALDRAQALDSTHPGACHLYIHAVEAMYPEKAVACAERLAGLMPAAGHLVHMPGHIYIRVGRYVDAIKANEHAVHADETYIRDQNPEMGVYTVGYYPHNYDFLTFAAAMAGRETQSLGAADKLASLVPDEVAAAPGMTFMQHHKTRALQFRVRFERWDEILAMPKPADGLVHAQAIWQYARGRALAAKGRFDEADQALAQLRAATTDPRLDGVRLEFNDAQPVLRIAEQVLTGVIASGRERHEDAVAALTKAAELEDALTYGEPPDWSVPVRHDLGAALLAAGKPDAAARAFEQDLKRFPANTWALSGLEQAHRAAGRTAEAARVARERAALER